MAFNSADTAAFKNVWVFCEQRQGVMMPTTFELISEGRKLADELGVELCGILLGDNVDGIAAELGEYGADKVYVYNSPLLKDFTTDAYTKVIVQGRRKGMQIKTRSTLPAGAFFIQVVVLLDLVVLVCVLTIMTSRVGMAYGYEVKAPSSHFLMNIVGDVEFISVTAGCCFFRLHIIVQK